MSDPVIGAILLTQEQRKHLSNSNQKVTIR